jgi:MFS family permease
MEFSFIWWYDKKRGLFLIIKAIVLGIIGSLFSVLQFFSSTLCGIASDRYGRKPILLLSMVQIND